jgi:hypothetical protein
MLPQRDVTYVQDQAFSILQRFYSDLTPLEPTRAGAHQGTLLAVAVRLIAAGAFQQAKLQLELLAQDQGRIVSLIKSDAVSIGWDPKAVDDYRPAIDAALRSLEAKAAPLLN